MIRFPIISGLVGGMFFVALVLIPALFIFKGISLVMAIGPGIMAFVIGWLLNYAEWLNVQRDDAAQYIRTLERQLERMDTAAEMYPHLS